MSFSPYTELWKKSEHINQRQSETQTMLPALFLGDLHSGALPACCLHPKRYPSCQCTSSEKQMHILAVKQGAGSTKIVYRVRGKEAGNHEGATYKYVAISYLCLIHVLIENTFGVVLRKIDIIILPAKFYILKNFN